MKPIWIPPLPPGPEVTTVSVVGRIYRRSGPHWLRYDGSEWSWDHLVTLAVTHEAGIFDVSDKDTVFDMVEELQDMKEGS